MSVSLKTQTNVRRNIAYADENWPEGFWDWLADNEHIYQGFVELALKMKNKGRSRWSAFGIINVLRWHTALKEKGDKALFKINNNYAPGLARLAMHEFPKLEGFFQLRS